MVVKSENSVPIVILVKAACLCLGAAYKINIMLTV